MNRPDFLTKPSTNALYCLALTLVFGFALFLRTYFPYNNVFTGEWVRFKWYDAWYHMRLVENLVHHFPSRIYFDPYTFYPHGQDAFFAPFYDLLLGFFVWLFGAGSPSQGVIETVGAYFPAVLGSLVVVPVYLISREMFNNKTGLIAAALIAILPGQFLLRSLLGFTDHHVAETMFSTLTILFLILALKSAKRNEISFTCINKRAWVTLKKPLLFTLLTGITLGCYMLTWVGGALLAFTLFLFFVIQYIIDHLSGRNTDYLCIVGTSLCLISMLMIAPFAGLLGYGQIHVVSLLLCILAFPALFILSLIMIKRNIRRFYYPLAVAVLASIGYILLLSIKPSVLNFILGKLNMLWPSAEIKTIGETMSLSISIIWEDFTTTLYLAMASLLIIAYRIIKYREFDKTLLFVWSGVMIMATFGQNRFSYYSAVNVSILTGYLSWQILALANTAIKLKVGIPNRVISSPQPHGKKGESKSGRKLKRKKDRARRTGLNTLLSRYHVARYALSIMTIAVIFFMVFYPNIGSAIDIASSKSYPTQELHDALVWMRANTTDPFQDPDFYYEVYEKPAEGKDYIYPDSAYGILNWWDYGHCITYISHRIPNANPFQSGAKDTARFFIAQDEQSANFLIDELGSRYIIIDLKTALHQIDPEKQQYGYFAAIIDWAGNDTDEFYEKYFAKDEEGKLRSAILYYPSFYQSMSSRLYTFGGEEYIPNNETWVISFVEKTDRKGVKYKEIDEQQRFATYEEAELYLEARNDPNYKIVSNNPLESCVPLERLEHYKLVYQSNTTVVELGERKISEVEIFEYTP